MFYARLNSPRTKISGATREYNSFEETVRAVSRMLRSGTVTFFDHNTDAEVTHSIHHITPIETTYYFEEIKLDSESGQAQDSAAQSEFEDRLQWERDDRVTSNTARKAVR